MIKSTKSKKIKAFMAGDTSKIDSRDVKSVRVILTALETAIEPEDFDLPGKDLHQLKQYDPVRWSLRASANWRVTFVWDGRHVYDIDYLDPH